MDNGWISFTVPGMPRGKERPRATRARKRPYTPARTVRYERGVRDGFLTALCVPQGAAGAELPIKGPVEAEVSAYYPIPKSFSTAKVRQALAGILRPTRKPDADNIVKAILDPLNGLAYGDDAQVARIRIEKFYCFRGEERVDVRLRPLCSSGKDNS